jgi:hypothetical protein
MATMFSDRLVLQGKSGVQQLDAWGPYAVIVNKHRFEQGEARKFALVNVEAQSVDSVHPTRGQAARQARKRHAA